jgi:hypothetical protein
MNDARADDRNEATQPSIESARETAVRGLAQHAISGSLTLDEYAERATAVQQAATADELDAAVQGLPEETAGVSPARRAGWLVAVFGGTEQRGRWRLSNRLRLVVAFGGATLDLGTAQPEAAESVITVVAVLGGAEILVPQGVSIQLSGFSLFGGKGDKRAGGPLLPGSPLIRVRAFTLLGGVTVKDNSPRRNLLDVIRARRSKPAGS